MSLLSDGVCSARLECSQSGKILQVDMGYYGVLLTFFSVSCGRCIFYFVIITP